MTLPISSPESQGVPSGAISAFLREAEALSLPLHSVLLLRHGQLIAERYAPPYDAHTPHRIYSASKSFVALAIGLLVGEGRLAVTDRLADHFPESVSPATDPPLLETTVEDLLRMAPPFGDERYDSLQGPVVDAFFQTKTTHPAGAIFCYNAASPAVLTALVEKLSGRSLMDYLWLRLLEPMGFSPETWCVKMPQGLCWGASGIMPGAASEGNCALIRKAIRTVYQLPTSRGKGRKTSQLQISFCSLAVTLVFHDTFSFYFICTNRG